MKMTAAVLVVLGLVANTNFAQDQEQIDPPAATPQSLKDKASYLLGYNMITELRAQQIDFDLDRLIQGMREAMGEKQPPMTDEEIRNVMLAFERQMMQRQQAVMKEAGEENLREGEAFLKENADKPGVQQTASGLQYIVVKESDGPRPQVTDKVKVRYVGSLVNGQVFDSTEGGEPAVFTVGALVRGMTEALQLMKVGSKWKLFIPGALAFGPAGRPPDIGPNQTIIFELELVEIVK